MYLSEIVCYSIMVLFIVGALRKPFIGLIGYYFFAFLIPQHIYWYSLRGTRFSFYIAAATIISTFFHFGGRDKSIKRVNAYVVFLIIFYLLALNSYFFAGNQEIAYRWIVLFSKIILMSLITILVIENYGQIRIMIILLACCLGYLALHSNYQYLTHQVWRVEAPGEPGAPIMDNSAYAMEFVMAIPFAFFIFFTEKKNFLLRWGIVGLVPFMIHTIILTYSRSGFIGMVVVLTVCVLFLKNRKWAIVAGAAIFYVVIRLQGQESEQRVQTIFEYQEERSAIGRFEAWEAASKMIQNNPWSGVGLGNFEINSMNYNPVITIPRAAHNAYLNIGAEMGIPAFIVFVSNVILVFIQLRQMLKHYRPSIRDKPNYYYLMTLFVSWLGYCICAMFLSLSYFEMFYFVLTLIAAHTNIYRRDIKISQTGIAAA